MPRLRPWHGSPSGELLCGLDVGEHFLGMSVGLHFLEDVRDIALGTDEESGSLDAHYFFAVHVLFFEDVELLGNVFVGVGEQGVGQVVFFLELLLSRRSVGRNAEYDESGLLKFAICVAEPARFYGSTGRVGSRIEEQNHVLPTKLLERNRVSVLVWKTKIRYLVDFIHISTYEFRTHDQHSIQKRSGERHVAPS